jgi:hypothetical protein
MPKNKGHMIATSEGRRKIFLGFAGLLAGTVAATVAEAQDAPSTPAKKEKNVVAGEKEAKKLLLLMDKDMNGKVSKAEFMSFMEEEFNRLDKDKNGELDVQELTQARVRTSSAHSR